MNRHGDSPWRLLRAGAAPGAWNMAVDDAIARSVATSEAPPTLRLYAWSPPCVSLGRNQAFGSVDAGRCAALGYDIVRRPTGGRAILHTDELTYSVIAPDDHPLMQGMILEVYLRIAQGLVAGLARLGAEAATAPEANRAGPDASAACFEVPSAYEIVVDGRKLLGSAQNRRAGYVLQHGSLPLVGDVTRLIECLTVSDEAERDALRASLHAHALTLEQALGCVVSFDQAADALAAGLSDALGIVLEPGALAPAELECAESLAREKYGHAQWTERT
jgi:lipoate-protein ligase A